MQLSLDLPPEELLDTALAACGLRLLDVAFVNVVGSRAEGLARSGSDFDLLVVCADGVPAPFDRRVTTLLGRAIDIEPLALADYRTRLSSDAWWPAGARRQDLLELRTRLTHGHCLHGTDVFNGLIVGWDADVHRIAVENHFHNRAEQCFDEVLDALSKDALERSALVARTLLEHVVEALLARRGDLYLRPKWRLERIDRTLQAHMGDHLRLTLKHHLLGATMMQCADLRAWTHQIVRFVRHLQGMHHFNPAGLDQLRRACLKVRCTDRLYALFPDPSGNLSAHVWGHRIPLTKRQAELLLAIDNPGVNEPEAAFGHQVADVAQDLARLERAGLIDCPEEYAA